MAIQMNGGCACGSIRYECSAAPIASFNCHCRDCQRASGSAFAAAIALRASAVKVIGGEAKYHSVKAESGNMMSRGFCPQCGSPLFIKTSGRPELIVIQAASLDDPSAYQPALNIWTSSAQS